MSGAQSWSVKGIDPKVREAAREAAARQGMTLGEYLSLALQNHQPGQGAPPQAAPNPQPRMRAPRLIPHPYDEDDSDDWQVGSMSAPSPRITDPVRLAQRIDSIERRTQLAVTGLDRAVSTIDRSVLGLAARLEDAESISRESADRIAEALEQFRHAGDTLGGRLERAEQEVGESREALDSAKIELNAARERLEQQVATAEEIARKAGAAAEFLTAEMGNREAALNHKLGAFEDQTRDKLGALENLTRDKLGSFEDHARDTFARTLSDARAAAEEAARQAQDAAADAVSELRQLRAQLTDRIEEAEQNTRRAVETAIEDARGVRAALIEEVVRLESEIGARSSAADVLKAEQAALISRIEKAEAGARESTAGLRQAAGAAIADLRNAQLGLAARLKQVEDAAGRAGALDLADVRTQQTEIVQRLASLETQHAPSQAFDQRLTALEQRPQVNPVDEALAAFERRLQEVAEHIVTPEKLEEVGGAVRTLDQSLQRLAERLVETESTANSAIRTLEETVSGLASRIDNTSATEQTEALRAMLEQRLDTMNQSVTNMVAEARTELAGQVTAALEGVQSEGLEGALADVNRRLAAAERRQAQTIEAISIEIKRMSETVDRRLRSVESRNDDAAGTAVREELARMGKTLEARFEEIERREAAAFDRMGLEVGRLSERLEERVGAVEGRSAQAIEHVGEQVARMAERFNQRHELLARDLGERMLDSEERSGARVSDAISSIMQRLGEVEERSAEAVAPVQKAVSSVASRLEQLESEKDDDGGDAATSRLFDEFTIPTATPSPMQAAQPLRAGPLPPTSPVVERFPEPPTAISQDHDIYFAEDVDLIAEDAPIEPTPTIVEPQHFESKPYISLENDDVVIDDPFLENVDAFAPPPPEDDDPFWTPDAPAPSALPPLPDTITTEVAITLEAPAPSATPGKNDYLNAARKAAQAQATPAKSKGRPKEVSDANTATASYSLRGSSRVVLWGAASAIALLLAGGAWYLNAREDAARPEPAQPEPEVTPPTELLAPPAETYDPAAPFGDPVGDPALATEDGVTEDPTPAPTEAPLAESRTAGRNAAVVAGPLGPRNVSLEQAAQSGDSVAQYELGLQRIAAGRTEDGVGLLRRAADRGLAMAQYRLAKLYERGEGVPTDLNMARQWTERAAAAGNRRAMHDLGVYFARGEGAPLDEAAAFRWFRQAAELGVADSQYNLGVLYQQGRGVGASPSEAMFWFLVAARQGDQDAATRASTLEAQLTPTQIEQARARAQAFRPRAASAQANGEFGARAWARPAA